MLIRAINCKQLFTKNYVEEIKDRIKMYRQGFMIAGNELYLPLYQVLRACYTLPDDYTSDVIDIDNVTNTDALAFYFKQANALDVDDIIDSHHAMQLDDDFSKLLTVVDEIAQARYETGYSDGEDDDHYVGQ